MKQCLMCGNMFEAQKVTTLYCSHKCNSKHYKLKKQLERKEIAEAVLIQPQRLRPKVKAIDRAMIKDKEFLTVKEVSILFGCSPKTVYSLIHTQKLKAANIGKKRFVISKLHLDKLFEE
ncbi:MAG: helix-turn-helix domain-containing protein [Sphingobacteriales bacterium]|nr:helix-turn-helix domain-containing protein [Sphingobacteriales bacterium]